MDQLLDAAHPVPPLLLTSSAAGDTVITPERLWDDHGSRVFKFAAMLSRNDQEAEDLAQEALLRAIKGLPRFQPKRGGVEAWLWRIVVNTGRDFGRAARRRHLLLERLQLLDRPHPPAEDAERHVTGAVLLDAVRALPKRQRTLLALRFGADLDYAAVGKAIGLSAVAARGATRRALTSLRKDLEGSEQR
jgi:RNA polymerase sigma-70 factor (ECF subfamily)